MKVHSWSNYDVELEATCLPIWHNIIWNAHVDLYHGSIIYTMIFVHNARGCVLDNYFYIVSVIVYTSLIMHRYLTLWLKIVLVLNMGVLSGMRHWTIILNGFFNIESAPISVDGEIVCAFWHTRLRGQVSRYLSSTIWYDFGHCFQ